MKWDLALSERFTRWKQYQLCRCSCFALWVKCYDNTSKTVGAEFIPRRENEIQTWQIRHKYKNKNNEHTKIITWSPEITSKACFIIIHNKNTLKHALLSPPVLMFPHKHWTDIVKTGSRSKHGSEWDISTQSGLLKGHRDTHTTHKHTQFIQSLLQWKSLCDCKCCESKEGRMARQRVWWWSKNIAGNVCL